MKTLKQELAKEKASKEEVEEEMNKLRNHYEEQLAVVDRSSLQSQYYTMSQKNKTLNSCPQFLQVLTDFQNSFTDRLSDKFAAQAYLNISPHLKYVATLPCEI